MYGVYFTYKKQNDQVPAVNIICTVFELVNISSGGKGTHS